MKRGQDKPRLVANRAINFVKHLLEFSEDSPRGMLAGVGSALLNEVFRSHLDPLARMGAPCIQ
jgi:hypothetical protein